MYIQSKRLKIWGSGVQNNKRQHVGDIGRPALLQAPTHRSQTRSEKCAPLG